MQKQVQARGESPVELLGVPQFAVVRCRRGDRVVVYGADPQPALPRGLKQGVGDAVELPGAQPAMAHQMRLGHRRVQPRHHDLQVGHGEKRPFFADLETDVRVRAVETAQQPVEECPFRPVRRDRLLVHALLLEEVSFAEFLVDVMTARDDREPVVVEA